MAPVEVDGDGSLEDLIAGLEDHDVRELLEAAAGAHEDVLRAVRLAAAGPQDRLAVLKSAVDDALRTRRHLDYWASSEWARDAAPVVDALAREVAAEPSRGLVELLQRAAGHLVKVILRADDSNGMIGDLCREVLELHRQACAAEVADPGKLARWMVKFSFDDQDFFEIDPVAYVDALGDKGLAVYRREVDKRSTGEGRSDSLRDLYGEFPSFAAKYAAERLAIIDRDVDRLIDLLGGDLSSPYQFQRVAEAFVELGQRDEALAWARRGIAETSGWQVAKLYDLAAELLDGDSEHQQILDLRREQHERTPSTTTYTQLRTVANALGVWDDEVDRARAVLAQRDVSGYVSVLLDDGEPDEAWSTAHHGDLEFHVSLWVRLAAAREPTAPADAMAVYLRLADDALVTTGKQAYRDAIRYLKAARRAAVTAGETDAFGQHLAVVRENNRRRPSFMTMLDKAALGA